MIRQISPVPTLALLCALALAGSAGAAERAAPAGAAKVAAADQPPAAPPSGAVAGARAGAKSAEAPPGCARKVKVIYAGYGEADRAPCPMVSADAAR
jgi:hypothetical protein